ncbi:uncharacterized protein LOC127576072 isoform X2 [Pristis pectinata]|uniref:uncharacterized protein LOC127576072 isoform X2 n=1 Tax=Pristis pectinata TaxID=685728 RepID=UPI00223D114E|nr:uncharacterized protein LOC127576072 isoform X2 [Pristis pectinata]
MHRAYEPVLPCGSKLLQQRWDLTCYREHRRKLEEDHLSNIERNNKKLLEKMSTIMRTTGRVDNMNQYKSNSLNREKRQRELERVTRENQAMQERLKRVEPQYNHLKWLEDWYKSEEHLDKIARYPRGWYIAQKSKPKSKARKVKSAKNSEKIKNIQVRRST